MHKVHLIREFAPDAYEFALSSWSWIGIGDKTPRFASCFGDMFLESLDGWWFLDTVEGTLERRWNTMDAMFADLQGADGRAEYLLEETLNTALEQGLQLGDGEVFAFLPPPAVTGTMSVSSLAPLRFAIATNLAGRIHGELNGVQPDAGASALFAAQKFAAQRAESARVAQAAAQQATAGRAAFNAPNPQTDRWEPAAQQVNTGAYPAYRPTPEPAYAAPDDAASEYVGTAYSGTDYAAPAYSAPAYAAGSELDYGAGQGSGQAQGYDAAGSAGAAYAADGAYAAAPEPAYPGQRAAAAAAAASAGSAGYDYLDNSHTADSGQFSQYIADQYNTGQVAAVDRGAAPAAIQPRPQQGGRWSYA